MKPVIMGCSRSEIPHLLAAIASLNLPDVMFCIEETPEIPPIDYSFPVDAHMFAFKAPLKYDEPKQGKFYDKFAKKKTKRDHRK